MYSECIEYCTNNSSQLASNISNDPTRLLIQKLNINQTYWVNFSETLNKVTHRTMCSLLMACPNAQRGCPSTGFASFSIPCAQNSYCICERELLTRNIGKCF